MAQSRFRAAFARLRRHLLPALFALAVLSLLWVLFFWRLLTPNPADQMIFPEGDFTQHYYAFSAYQVERLAEGDFPTWNPYNHSGDPFAANIQFVAFYPPRLLAAAIVGADWSLMTYQHEVAVHYWLASVLAYGFFYLLVRRGTIALFGAVLYAYSGYLTGYPMLQVSVLESVIWLPLIMIGVHLAGTRGGIHWLIWGPVVAGIGVALSFLGGHPQTTMQITYFALAYLAFLTWQRGRSLRGFIARAGIFGGVGAGLAAIQLLPAAEFTMLSYRVTQLGFADKANGFQAGEFLQVIWPGVFGVWSPLYLGAIGLLLAVGAALRPRGVHLFWIAAIVVGVFLSLGGNSILYDAFYLTVPGFSIFRQQERIASVIVFALVALAVSQLAWLLRRDGHDSRFYSWLVYGYAALTVAVYLVGTVAVLLAGEAAETSRLDIGGPVDIFGFVALFAVAYAGWYRWRRDYDGASAWPVVLPLLFLLVIDLFTVGTRSENFLPDTPENRVQVVPELAFLQTEPEDIRWRVDGAAGLQGNGVLFGIPDIYGTGPFSLESIEELRQIPVERFWEVLAVRYITTSEEPPEDVPLELLAYGVNYTEDEFRLFELQDPRPLAHLIYDYRPAEGSAAFARQIMSDPRVDLREMAVTLNPLPIDLPGQHPEVSAISDFTIISPEEMTMTVSTSENALLTVSQVNYPGWRAFVDGEQVEIVDTYAGLVGIPLEAGTDQQVRLAFASDTIRLGGLLTLLTLVGAIVLVIAGFIWRLNRRV